MSPIAFPQRTGLPVWCASAFCASIVLAGQAPSGACSTNAIAPDSRALSAIAPPSTTRPRLLETVSGLPSVEERNALLPRQRTFALRRAKATIEVYPVRVGAGVDSECAALLARRLCAARIGERCAIAAPLLLSTSAPDPHTQTALWDLARAFRAHLRSHPSGADYAVYAELHLDSCAWERGSLLLVVCESRGDWVIVDLQDSRHPDYELVRPITSEGGTELVVLRFQAHLARALPDASVDSRGRRDNYAVVPAVANPSRP